LASGHLEAWHLPSLRDGGKSGLSDGAAPAIRWHRNISRLRAKR